MTRSRAFTALSAAVLSASLLAGCSSSEEEVIPIAEPVLDFPQTSTTPTPTPTMDEDEEEEDDADETEEETTTSSSSTSTTSTTSTRSSTSSTRSSSGGSGSGGSSSGGQRREPAPAPAAPAPQQNQAQPEQPGAACPWPSQRSETEEYSTFCDREWARTITPDNDQDYYWVADGKRWVSVDPAGTNDNGPCWNRDDFADAPEAIRNAVTFCS